MYMYIFVSFIWSYIDFPCFRSSGLFLFAAKIGTHCIYINRNIDIFVNICWFPTLNNVLWPLKLEVQEFTKTGQFLVTLTSLTSNYPARFVWSWWLSLGKPKRIENEFVSFGANLAQISTKSGKPDPRQFLASCVPGFIGEFYCLSYLRVTGPALLYHETDLEPKWVRLAPNWDNLRLFHARAPNCTEIWHEKVPDLSHFGRICSTFGPNLTFISDKPESRSSLRRYPIRGILPLFLILLFDSCHRSLVTHTQ